MVEQDDKCIKFIWQDEEGKFQLHDKGLEFLNNLPDDFELSMVAIAGKYRTGKSYFINKVVLNEKIAFEIGSSIEAQTKGLWMYKQTLPTNEYNKYLIVFDSEGLGSTNFMKQSDYRIFLIAILLSTKFIFNSVGTIDENSIKEIANIINIAKQIQTNQKCDIDFPDLLWVIRDFTLQLKDKNDQVLSFQDYLEQSLEIKGNPDSEKNQQRKLIKQFFQNRDCQCMVRPIESEKYLQLLPDMSDHQLRSTFLQQVKDAREKIYSNIKVKQINGMKLTGKLFASYCEKIVNIFNSNDLPDIKQVWQYVLQNQAKNIFNQIKKNVQERIKYLQNQQEFDFKKEKIQIINMNLIQIDEIQNINVQELRQDFLIYVEDSFDGLQKQSKQKFQVDIQQIEDQLISFQIQNVEQFLDLIERLKNKIQIFDKNYSDQVQIKLLQKGCQYFSNFNNDDLKNQIKILQLKNQQLQEDQLKIEQNHKNQQIANQNDNKIKQQLNQSQIENQNLLKQSQKLLEKIKELQQNKQQNDTELKEQIKELKNQQEIWIEKKTNYDLKLSQSQLELKTQIENNKLLQIEIQQMNKKFSVLEEKNELLNNQNQQLKEQIFQNQSLQSSQENKKIELIYQQLINSQNEVDLLKQKQLQTSQQFQQLYENQKKDILKKLDEQKTENQEMIQSGLQKFQLLNSFEFQNKIDESTDISHDQLLQLKNQITTIKEEIKSSKQKGQNQIKDYELNLQSFLSKANDISKQLTDQKQLFYQQNYSNNSSNFNSQQSSAQKLSIQTKFTDNEGLQSKQNLSRKSVDLTKKQQKLIISIEQSILQKSHLFQTELSIYFQFKCVLSEYSWQILKPVLEVINFIEQMLQNYPQLPKILWEPGQINYQYYEQKKSEVLNFFNKCISIDKIYNCQKFKDFLKVDTQGKIQNPLLKSQTPVSIRKNQSFQINQEIIGIKKHNRKASQIVQNKNI